MSHRLRGDEPIVEAVRRISAKHFKGAAKGCAAVSAHPKTAVHKVRLHLKKARAVLKLVRTGLRREDWKLNAQARDQGRLLAGLRDRQVLRQAAKSIRDNSPSRGRKNAKDLLKTSALAARRREAPYRAAKAGRKLEALQRGAARILIQGDAEAALFAGLEHSYRCAARAWTKSRQSRSVATLHECRKRAKDLTWQLDILRDLSPEMISAQMQVLKEFTDALGDHRDAHLLKTSVLDGIAGPEPNAQVAAAVSLVEAAQGERLTRAEQLAPVVFAEKPRAFIERLRAYWAPWRRE